MMRLCRFLYAATIRDRGTATTARSDSVIAATMQSARRTTVRFDGKRTLYGLTCVVNAGLRGGQRYARAGGTMGP